MSDVPDLTGKVTVPVFHLFDEDRRGYLKETEGRFELAPDLGGSTSYWTADEAHDAARRAGDTVTVTGLVAYVDPA